MNAPRVPRPLVLEVVGPAGAGKSAVAKWLAQHVATLQIVPRAGGRGDMLWFASAAIRLLPEAAEAARGDRGFARAQLRHLIRLDTLRRRLAVASRSGHSVLLLDEGPLYSLARLRAFWPPELNGGRLDARLRRVTAGWMRGLDIVVHLDAPNELLARRIERRDKDHRMRGQSEATIFGFLDRYRAAYADLLSEARSRRHIAVIDIDTSVTSIADCGALVAHATARRVGVLAEDAARSLVDPPGRSAPMAWV